MTDGTSSINVGREVILPDDLRHGSGCVVGHRAVIGSGCTLGDRVHIGPNATVLAPPASAALPPSTLVLRDGVTIGAAAVVCGARVIGVGARVEPGSVVTQDVPPFAIVSGNPAQVVGYSAPPGIDQSVQPVVDVSPPSEAGAIGLIGGASLVRFPEVIDLRGSLTFGEVDGLLPFEVRRFFFVYGVPTESIRGEHAHREIHQLLICTSGTIRVSLTDGYDRRGVVLDEPSVGLHIPPLVWATQFRHGPSTCLLVLCSGKYESAEYIRDFDEYMAEIL